MVVTAGLVDSCSVTPVAVDAEEIVVLAAVPDDTELVAFVTVGQSDTKTVNHVVAETEAVALAALADKEPAGMAFAGTVGAAADLVSVVVADKAFAGLAEAAFAETPSQEAIAGPTAVAAAVDDWPGLVAAFLVQLELFGCCVVVTWCSEIQYVLLV